MSSPAKLFAATLCCFAFTVVHIYGELVELVHPYDIETHTSNYTCISDDDGSALAWVHYNTLARVEDFKPRRPATGNVRDCATRDMSVCLGEWDTTSDWRVVNSAAKPTGPIYDQRWEDFQHFEMPSGRIASEWRYEKVGVVNKSSSTLQFSVQEAPGAEFGILLCEREEPHLGPCVWIQGTTIGRINVKFCDRGAATRDGYVDDSKCTVNSTKIVLPAAYGYIFYEWNTFRLEWNTQLETIKMLWGNNSAPLVEGLMPPWDQVSAVGASVRGHNFRLKFHFFDYYFTDTKNAVIFTKRIDHLEKMFCAELPVGLCPRCKLNVSLVDESGNDIETWLVSGDGQDPYNGLLAWQLVRLNKRFATNIPRRLTLKTRSIFDGDEGAGEWAIDNFRMCQPGKLRESTLSIEQGPMQRSDRDSNSFCQKISYDGSSMVRYNFHRPNVTQVLSELQEFLHHQNRPLVGRGGVICSSSGCICDRGLTGMDCADECNDGFYGYECTETCGSCRNSEPCVKSIGFCDGGCQGDMIMPFCKKSELME